MSFLTHETEKEEKSPAESRESSHLGLARGPTKTS